MKVRGYRFRTSSFIIPRSLSKPQGSGEKGHWYLPPLPLLRPFFSTRPHTKAFHLGFEPETHFFEGIKFKQSSLSLPRT
jgi:hypothetical protein